MHLPTPCSRGNEGLWDLPHGAIPSPRVQATCATAAMAYKHMSSQEVVRMDKLMKNGLAYPLPPVVRRCAWLNYRVNALQTNKHWGLCPVPLQARNKHGACGA